jgi:hypothetical protein
MFEVRGARLRKTNPIWPAASGPRRAKCAKRTQFPAGRDIPAFHYSSPKRVVRNEANLPPRAQEPLAGRAASAAGGASCTNRPNLPMGREMGTGRRSHRQSRRGSVAPNKPNLPRSNQRRLGGKAAGGADSRGKRAKRTQFPAVPGGTRPQRRATQANCAKQSQFVPYRPEKALAGRAGRSAASRADRAKRSQFVPERNEGQVLCGKRVITS